jgi:hypothetical protein
MNAFTSPFSEPFIFIKSALGLKAKEAARLCAVPNRARAFSVGLHTGGSVQLSVPQRGKQLGGVWVSHNSKKFIEILLVIQNTLTSRSEEVKTEIYNSLCQ